MTLEFSAIEFEYCGSLELLEEFFHKYINIRSCQLLRINPETKKWNCSMATRANRKETISDVIDKMTENVEFADRFMNKNGSLRKTPLKKKRAISKLEFFIPEYEYRRLKKMKNPIETLERPVEHMTVYRNDGSSVTLTAENGRVSIVDSREKNVRHIIEADYFVSKIL